MDELRRINAKIDKQQIGRIVGGIGSIILGVVLIGKLTYQKGVTDCQRAISKEFPEEYEAMTAKIIEAFEKE